MQHKIMKNSLANKKVLLTRQAGFADQLVSKISAYGATCINKALFTVESTIDANKISQIRNALHNSQLAIFVSRNAAELVLPYIEQRSAIKLATVGPATAEYLQQNGFANVICPLSVPYDSRSLVECLKNSQLLSNKLHITLFNGEEGLTWLAEELGRNGCQAEVVSVYRRHILDINDLPETNIIVISCVTSLLSLKKFAEKILKPQILAIPLLVVSERIYKRAIEMGFLTVYTTKGMSEADIITALLERCGDKV